MNKKLLLFSFTNWLCYQPFVGVSLEVSVAEKLVLGPENSTKLQAYQDYQVLFFPFPLFYFLFTYYNTNFINTYKTAISNVHSFSPFYY